MCVYVCVCMERNTQWNTTQSWKDKCIKSPAICNSMNGPRGYYVNEINHFGEIFGENKSDGERLINSVRLHSYVEYKSQANKQK